MPRSKSAPGVDAYPIGCPYCGASVLKTISTSEVEVVCPKCSKETSWHEGIFSAQLFRLIGRDSRSLQRGGPKRYVLRGKGFTEELVVSFNTTALLSLRIGDIISLSYPRTSKGIFRKKWDYNYSESPTVLWNNTANYCWKL